MPYKRDINAVIERVLQADDIREGLASSSSSVNSAYLRAALRESAETIWMEAAKPISELEVLEAEVLSERTEMRVRLAKTPKAFPMVFRALLVLPVVFVVAEIYYNFFHITVPDISYALWRSYFFGLMSVLESFLGLATIFWASINYFRLRRMNVFFRDDQDARKFYSLRVVADDAVYRAALQNATRIINEASASFFQKCIVLANSRTSADLSLRKTSARGLSEILNPANEIATDSHRRVLELVEGLPGASIGIAGPRGAGKSALLWSICGTNPKVRNGEAIAVYTSAPVEYDPRDFLLHLFACLSQQVMKTKGIPDRRDFSFSTDEPEDRAYQGARLRVVERVASILRLLGFTAITLGLLVSFLVATILPPAVANSTGAAQTLFSLSFLQRFINTLDFKPGSLVLWGLIAFVAGAIVSSPFRPMFYMFDADRDASSEYPEPELAKQCRKALRDIRFQRSYSTGWSGSLKIFAGIESNTTTAISISQKQRSVPEIVEDFRAFVESVTLEYSCVIIGIDELDKLESDQKAQQFVNEIKAVFNIPKCFFLVSVSENAISSFERRGMPFRDAFDSAFDDIERVDYFSLQESRKLLARRAINLPGPFLCLCHVISAGLPRDLIRAARTMLEHVAKHPKENTIAALSTAMLCLDIQNKLRATAAVARAFTLDPELTDFLKWAARLEVVQPLSAEFWSQMARTALVQRQDLDGEERKIAREILRFYSELDAFVAYAVTAIELFAAMRVEADWKTAELSGWVDELARARQALELSPAVARLRIDELRRSCKLTPLWGDRTIP